jgi:hypothetical protein
MKRFIMAIIFGWLMMRSLPMQSYAQDVSFVEQPIDLNVLGISCIKIFDLDRDGKKDIIGGTEIPGKGIYWWRNNGGDPVTWTRFTIDNALDDAMSVEVDYIDNDTFPDIVATELYQGQIDWWGNNGDPTSVWTKHIIGASYGAHDAMCADINADGTTDIIGVSSYPGSISIFYNDGAEIPGWTEHSLCDSLAGAKTVTIRDIDRDGDLDVIGAAEMANIICWWENHGSFPINWEEHIIDSDFDGAQIAIPVLIDGDSLYDIIAAGAECNQVAYWICQDLAANQWVKHIVTDQLEVAVNVRCGDFDGDGDQDIVAVGMIPGELSLYMNDSLTWIPITLRSDFGRGWALEVDDIDEDGDVDIWSGAEDLGALYQWENVPDFRPYIVPNYISILPGGSESILVSIDSHNDYHGTVYLSAYLNQEPMSGYVNFTFKPACINPAGSCSLIVDLSIDMAPGQYSIMFMAADSVDTLYSDSTVSLWVPGSGQAAVVGGDQPMVGLVRSIWEPVDSLWSVPPVIGSNYQALIIEHGATAQDTTSIREYIEAGGHVLLTRQTPYDLCGSTNITPISGWVGATGYGAYSGTGIPIVATYDQPFGVTGIQINDTIGTAVSGFGRLSGLGGNGVRVARLGTLNTILAGVYCNSGSGHCLYYTGGAGISSQSDSLIRGFLNSPALGVNDRDHEINAGPVGNYLKIYPNPISVGTTISFALQNFSMVNLDVYDVLGRKVRNIISERMQPGVYDIYWDGKTSNGQKVSAGIYFLRGKWDDKRKVVQAIVVR